MEHPQRIAIVHEWFTSMRGGEKCVEALCEVFPQATLFALVHLKGSVSPTIERMPIRTSFIQKLPFALMHYRHYLPLFPTAVDRFDLTGFDLIISSNHAVAKGVRVAPKSLHICYCYTPMRYIWGLYDDYFASDRSGFMTRWGMKLFVSYLRRWDVKTSANPHHFVAISENVKSRIDRIYRRAADVIYPPVDTSLFTLSNVSRDYYLIVSAFVPYKRIDLAIHAFNRTGNRLVIVGDGPDDERLRKLAGRNIEFLGWQPNARLKELYAGCRAVVFPGEEDFGIVPVEAMASGKPVIAYAKGGALETVIEEQEQKTGILFKEQSVEALVDALEKSKTMEFQPEILRAHAMRFDREVFKERMRSYIGEKWKEWTSRQFSRGSLS